MIAVSSYKPFKLSLECARNQIFARESLEDAVSKIVYFGDPCAALGGDNVEFIPCEQFPRIKDMAAYCARQPGFSAIINSDIVVDHRLRYAEAQLIRLKAKCAMSRRLTYRSIEHLDQSYLDPQDMGLDFFCATTDVWIAFHWECPEVLRVGHSAWDSYLNNFLLSKYEKVYYDLTPCRLFHHPIHGDRAPVHHIARDDSPYWIGGGWPLNQLHI